MSADGIDDRYDFRRGEGGELAPPVIGALLII